MKLFDVFGNICGAVFFFTGLILFIAAMHYLPDRADFERMAAEREQAMSEVMP